MTDVSTIRQTLAAHGQEHLLRFYDSLTPQRRQGLIEQLDRIDFDRIDTLIERYVRHRPEVEIPSNIQPPEIIPTRPGDAEARRRREAARARGEELIAAGNVAAFLVAGGQGSRLGYEGPKGCLEATPVAHKPLFQVFAEQILAARRRWEASIPWYVMTSPTNDVPTRAFFRQHNYFGLPDEDVFFLVQGFMPAIGYDGKLLLAEPGRVAMSPDGHGGALPALRSSGALEDMARRGVEHISYFQVDNPLVRAIDPVFVGFHAERGAEMSAKCLPKRDPMEKLGNLCVADGKVRVIEYSDMPEELARRTTDDGHLLFSAGSIAIHVLSRAFAERLTADGDCELPWHRADKKVAHVDETGRTVTRDEPNAVKLERFIFDALGLAEQVVVLETVRTEEFSPIKNASGADSLTTSLHDQVRRAAEWLEQAGVTVPRDADGQVAAAIEISPLFADSAAELGEKVDPNLNIAPGDKVYLGSRGLVGGEK